jgi:nucleoside 2-deoxyribosyltransferase
MFWKQGCMTHRSPEAPNRREPEVSSPLVYLAGPLFSKAERRYNLHLTERLEASGFRIFLPQRDGVQRETSPYDAMTPDRRRQAMFRLDRQQLLDCDVFLFVPDGRVPDEGACVELGIAYCQKYLQGGEKLLLGLHTDTRAAFIGSRLNPMVRVALDRIVDDEEALSRVLAQNGTQQQPVEERSDERT